jgi:hypothetical protein
VSIEIIRALGRIEGKLDLLIPATEAQRIRLDLQEGRISKIERIIPATETQRIRLDLQEGRVSKIERNEKYIAGFAAALALVVAVLKDLFIK